MTEYGPKPRLDWITASAVFFLLCTIYSESSPVKVTGDTPPHRSWFQTSLPSPQTYTWGARGYNDHKPHVSDLRLLGLHLLSVTSLSLYILGPLSACGTLHCSSGNPTELLTQYPCRPSFICLDLLPSSFTISGCLSHPLLWDVFAVTEKRLPLLISLPNRSLHHCYGQS